MSMTLVPTGGWQAFTRHEALIETCWSALTLSERGHLWHYLNPTSATSIWESDSGYLYLAYSDARGERVEEMVAHIEPGEDPCDFNDFISMLRATFELEALA